MLKYSDNNFKNICPLIYTYMPKVVDDIIMEMPRPGYSWQENINYWDLKVT